MDIDKTTVILVVIITALVLIMAIGGLVSVTVFCLKKSGTPESRTDKRSNKLQNGKPQRSIGKQHNQKVNKKTEQCSKGTLQELKGVTSDRVEERRERNLAYASLQGTGIQVARNEAYTSTDPEMLRNDAYSTGKRESVFESLRNEPVRAERTMREDIKNNPAKSTKLTRNEAYYSHKEHVGRREVMRSTTVRGRERTGVDIVMVNNGAYSSTGREDVKLTSNEAYNSIVRSTQEEEVTEYYNYYYMN